ncbi:hypothetical protein [Streptomyces sp. NPDC013740]|uniref:hypothetical protein n=1 Tax=Streptomyces sp. NPDC013740 TaxID=3364867 RepID=UPI0036F6F49D
MARGPDDDPRLFIEQQVAGFDTDGATGCFADAGAWKPLLALFERGLIQGERDLDAYGDIDDGSMFIQRTRDEASGGEPMAFATTGDSTHPGVGGPFRGRRGSRRRGARGGHARTAPGARRTPTDTAV